MKGSTDKISGKVVKCINEQIKKVSKLFSKSAQRISKI